MSSEEVPMLELRITVNSAGQVTVSGPLEHAVLCLGTLEMAKVVILDHQRKQMEAARRAKIEVATAGTIPEIKGRTRH